MLGKKDIISKDVYQCPCCGIKRKTSGIRKKYKKKEIGPF
jgi:hypothetical protein